MTALLKEVISSIQSKGGNLIPLEELRAMTLKKKIRMRGILFAMSIPKSQLGELNLGKLWIRLLQGRYIPSFYSTDGDPLFIVHSKQDVKPFLKHRWN